MVVNHRPRTHGHSKYGIGRTVRVILDLLTVKFLLSYSTRPLQIFGLIGFVLGILGTLISGWLAFERLRGAESLSNRPLLLLGILLISTGFQLVTLGLLAELQARTYHESHEQADLCDSRGARVDFRRRPPVRNIPLRVDPEAKATSPCTFDSDSVQVC